MLLHERQALAHSLILIVDDDVDNLSLLAGLLSEHGAAVRLARKGSCALESASAAPPDLILLDTEMPDLDGYTICERLKADPRAAAVPVIFLSARSATCDIVRAFAAGAADYITKPFAVEEVLARVSAHLRVQQMQRQLQGRLAQVEHEIEESERARLAAEEAARAKSEFVAQISHEIRTSLNVVIGMTTLVLGSALTPTQREDVESIRRSGSTLLALVDDTLDISRIEAGKLTLVQRPFALHACIEEALDLMASQADARQLELCYRADPELPPRIIGDSTRLRQIVINLLSNAIRYTERGEIVVTLAGKSRPQSGEEQWDLTISVRDTGIGIAPEHLTRIFQPFEQADPALARQYGGSGLGLAICRRLAELMGGQIRAESTPGVGSTFTVELPATVAPAAPTGPASDSALAGKRALLLVDRAETAELLQTHLLRWGMSATALAPAQDARAWLAEHSVDVVLLARDGTGLADLELIQELRTCGHPALPAVLWTRLSEHNTFLDRSDQQHTVLLSTPIRPGMLHEALRRLLRGDGGRPPSETQQIDATLGWRHPLHILLAEDNGLNRVVARRLLAKLGYEVAEATNGLEALEMLRSEQYDLALLDVQMPGMSGAEVTSYVRSFWPPQRRPRIVALTAHSSEADLARLLDIGMDDYICKPVSLEELTRVLRATWPRPQSRAAPADRHGSDPPFGALDRRAFAAFLTGISEQDPARDAAFVASYLAGMDEQLQELREALAAADVELGAGAAHSLKGLSLQIGAVDLSIACGRIEAACKDWNIMAGRAALGVLEEAYAAFLRALALQSAAAPPAGLTACAETASP